MSLLSWLLSKQSNTQSRGQMRTSAVPRFRPTLEALEDRAVPATLFVNTIAEDPTDGLMSLREAVADASSGDTIRFDSSLSGQTIQTDGNAVQLNKDLAIQGLGADRLAISGNHSYGSAVFQVAANTRVSLDGLTIRDGFQGIVNSGTLTMSNCVVSGNQSEFEGGGIYNTGSLTMTACTVSGNSARIGGGIYSNGALIVSACTISGNTACSAGGIYSGRNFGGWAGWGATATIRGSTISGNTATGGRPGSLPWSYHPQDQAYWFGCGGGIVNAAQMTITNTVLSGNAVPDGTGGGAIYNAENASLTLKDCTVTNNSAGYQGGGIFNDYRATLTIYSSTISKNTASLGDNIYNDGGYVTTNNGKGKK